MAKPKPEEPTLTRGNIQRHIRRLAIPAALGLLFHTMYNVVDNWFAGQLSTEALAAMGLSYPVFFILIAFSVGFGVGNAALIANALGEGDQKKAEQLIHQSILFGLALSLFTSFLGLVLAPKLFALTDAKPETIALALDYTRIIFWGAVTFIMSEMFFAPLNAIGEMKPFRNVSAFLLILNIGLNPALIYGWGPFPQLGFPGVAWSTILCEGIAALYFLYKIHQFGLLTTFRWKSWVPQLHTYLAIFKQGLPTSLDLVTIGTGFYLFTYFVSRFGDEALAAYSAAVRIDQLVILPLLGIEIAVRSIVGQNYGARNMERVKTTIWSGGRLAIRCGLLGGICIFITAPYIMPLFRTEPAFLDYSVRYLRIISFIYVPMALLFVLQSALQGMKRPSITALFGLLRQLVLPAIVLYIFIERMGGSFSTMWILYTLIHYVIIIAAILTVRSVLRKPPPEVRPKH